MRFRAAPQRFEHRLGSALSGYGKRGVPVCKNCTTPLRCVVQLAVEDPQLELAAFPHRRAIVLTCTTCDANTRGLTRYRPSRSGRSICLVKMPRGERLVERAGSPPIPMLGIEFEPGAPDRLDAAIHQFGGEPDWLDEPIEPRCKACDRLMPFLLQVDTEPEIGLEFADQGTLYAFACCKCAEVATIVQVAR